jgi:hypothetical protein
VKKLPFQPWKKLSLVERKSGKAIAAGGSNWLRAGELLEANEVADAAGSSA